MVILHVRVGDIEPGPVILAFEWADDEAVSLGVGRLERAPCRIEERVPEGRVGVDLPAFGRRSGRFGDGRRRGHGGLRRHRGGLALVAEEGPLLALAPVGEDTDPDLTARGVGADLESSALPLAEDRRRIGQSGLSRDRRGR